MPRKVIRPDDIEKDWEKRSQQLRRQAGEMSPGHARESLIDQADRLDAACRMRDWLKPVARGARW